MIPRGGRVLAVEGRTLTLWWSGQMTRVEMQAGAIFLPGDLVERGADQDWRLVARPTRSGYPAPESDGFRFLAEDPGRWARLVERARLLAATRRWFADRGFLEVETPLCVASPGTEPHLDAVAATLTDGPGAAPAVRYLITSPEYHMKRLLAAGAPPIFQICKVFRDGERGARHRPEFSMLEWYRPFAGLDAIADECEAWLSALLARPSLAWQGKSIALGRPWPRLPFLEALARVGVTDPGTLTPEEQLRAFGERVDPWLADAHQPTFVVEWPLGLASLARPMPANPRIAERFELYIAGLELGNAFGELCDPVEQRRRCELDNRARRAAGKVPYPIDEAFLGALEDGMPPSAGIAVGIDRVLMLCTGARAIDEVIAF